MPFYFSETSGGKIDGFRNPPRYVGAEKFVVSNGLLVHLDAANSNSYPGSGTTWFDLSGNGRNATINGSPTFTNGYFDITSDSTYISLSNSGLVPRTNDFTYSCWINFDAFDSFDTIFENGSWTDSLLLRYENNSTITVYSESGLRGTFNWVANTGVWYNIVLKRESNIVSLIVNNIPIGASFTMSLDIDLINTQLWLMRSQHSPAQFLIGKIASFLVYNRALQPYEIEQNYIVTRGILL